MPAYLKLHHERYHNPSRVSRSMNPFVVFTQNSPSLHLQSLLTGKNASRDLPWSIKGFTVRETLSNLHFDFPTLTFVMLAHWKLHRGCYHDLSWSLLPVKVYVMFTLSSTQIPAYNFHFLIFFSSTCFKCANTKKSITFT